MTDEASEVPHSPRAALFKIGTRLPLIMSSLVVGTILIMVIANSWLTERIIARSAGASLESVSVLKGKRIESLLAGIERDLRLRAADPATKTALVALTDGFQSLENPTEVLQRVYIEDNPHPMGEKDQLVSADTGSSYGFIHATYHPALDRLQNEMAYYDVFLFDTEGNLVYSVFKENDFATNMLNGAWKNSGLADAYRGAMETATGGPAYFVDFAPYAPSFGAPAAFIARPVFDDQGKRVGVLAYQMPIGQINLAMSDQGGLGETADGFLVGSDFLMRTDSAQTEEDDILTARYETDAVRKGLAGQSGVIDYIAPSGRDVLAYYAPVEFLGTTWVAIVQQDNEELFAGLSWALKRATAIAIGVLLAVLCVSIYFSRRITRPIQRLTGAVRKVADGKFDIDVPGIERTDELGELARATEVFRQNSIKIEKLNEEQDAASKEMAEMAAEREQAAQREVALANEKKEADRRAAKEREAMMIDLGESFGSVVNAALAGEFSRRVDAKFSDKILNDLAQNINQLMGAVDDGLSKTGDVLERVADGDMTQRMEGEFEGAFGRLQGNVNDMMDGLKTLITEITGSGTTLASSSAELRDTSDVLSKQAEQNAASLEETSAALDQLSTSIKQVNGSATDASKNAKAARDTAQTSEKVAADAVASMQSIADASKEITRVMGVIDDIAFQINLLALNAGVEAARAGEAGRGFSVVASEVRQLAQRAGEASKGIATVISKSDRAVAEGVEKVTGAQRSLEAIAESVIDISKGVEDISVAITEQVHGVGEITAAVGRIDQNTQKQAASFEEVSAAGALLANEAANLKRSTARFRTGEDAQVATLEWPASTPPKADAPRKVAASGGGGAADYGGWDAF